MVGIIFDKSVFLVDMTKHIGGEPAILVEGEAINFNEERDFMETRERDKLGDLGEEDGKYLVNSKSE